MTLADQLERINQVARTSPLSIPGDPSWPMERDRQENAKAEFARICRNNLATILTALRSADALSAREAEREACAKVSTSAAEPLDVSENITSDFAQGWRAGQRAFREAIRARSNGGNDDAG